MKKQANLFEQRAEPRRAESFEPTFRPVSDGKQRTLFGFPCESMCEKACENKCENACK